MSLRNPSPQFYLVHSDSLPYLGQREPGAGWAVYMNNAVLIERSLTLSQATLLAAARNYQEDCWRHMGNIGLDGIP